MPVAADRERELLNHYHITTLYPDTWPHSAADDSDDSDDFDDTEPHASSQPPSGGLTRQPSKLSARLTRHASIRSAGSLGPDSVVQKDEPDPLGTAPSVAAELRRRGLAVEDDLKLRNRFMLSSTSFSPALYLSQVHQDASTEELLRGLEFLGRSIEQKSASLKVLVESNFERFVKAKATIDNVYTEMRTQGQDESTAPLTPRPMSGRPGGGHSRQYSRSQPSTHFRTASGNTTTAFSPASVKNPGAPGSDKRQNALTKESEYGTLGIRTPLQDLTIKAEEVWGPTLGGREKEENVKSVLEALETHREVFRLPATLHEAIQRHDFDTVITSWTAAQRYADQARSLADGAKDNGIGLGDRDARHILLIAKMWADVSVQMDGYKRELWRRLKMNHGRKPAAVADETDKEEHLELTGVLLQLGVDENPIWEWLRGRHLYLKDKIVRSFERARVEIEVSRRRLAANDKQDGRQLAQYLRSASSNSSNVSALGRAKDETKEGDTPAVMHFWTLLHASLTHLLSSSSGILGEVLDFRSVTQSFIDGKAQKAFPPAVLNSPAAQEHLELEPEEVQNLRSAAIELMDLLRQGMLSFFADPPVEDLSELYSPLPPTPITPDLVSGPASPSQVRRVFSFDPTNAPPPSPKRGDSWEKFAFWPPRANSLSGSHHLARILALIGTAASELAGMPVVKQTRSGTEGLRTLVGAVRERVVQALCASWTADAEKFKYTETWHRSPERRDLTTMPANFMAFEESILVNFQKVAYVSEARGGGEQVIVSPPAKLLQAIRGTFVTSLYKILSGMVENAEKNRPRAAGEGDPDGVTVATMKALVGYESDGAIINGAVDASNRVSAFCLMSAPTTQRCFKIRN